MKSKFQISYILTHKDNQNSLEKLFSQIRGRGGLNDHPSLDAIYRIRMIVLGKNPGVVQKKLNTLQPSEPEEYIMAKIVAKAQIAIQELPIELPE